MNYNDLAKEICIEILNYSVTTESFIQVYDIVFEKYAKDYLKDKNKVLVKVVHFITVNGYDIDCIKPLKFKRFMD